MLRLKKLRRQRDQTTTSATEFVAQRTSERHRRLVGTVDEGGGPTAGRRGSGGECVRCARKASSEEPYAWSNTDTSRGGASTIDPQARAELELRHVGARGASEPGVSRVHAHRRRESTGCQDAGTVGASDRARSDRGATRTNDGVRAGARRDECTEAGGEAPCR